MAGSAYATTEELDAYLTDSPYELQSPPVALRLLRLASRLINSKTRMLAQDHWENPLPKEITLAASGAGTSISTSATHELVVGDPVSFLTLAGGAGLTPGTEYFVVAAGGTTFSVGEYEGGPALAFSTNITAGTVASKTEFQSALSNAACAQVEFWLEVGEEYDVVGLTGSAQVGRVNISNLPPRLGPRAQDLLMESGLMVARVWIR